MRTLSPTGGVPSTHTFNPTGDVMPTLIRSHSNSLHAHHRTFIGGFNTGDVEENYMNVDQDSGDEFYEKIIDDEFEEYYDKVDNSQVVSNPLYNQVKIMQ